MSKRILQIDIESDINTAKKLKSVDPININPVINDNDLNHKVLLVQNDHLYRRCTELETQNNELTRDLELSSKKNNKLEIIISMLRSIIQQHYGDVKYLLDKNGSVSIDENILDHYEPTFSFIDKFSHTSSESVMSDEGVRHILEETYQIILRLFRVVDDLNNQKIENVPVANGIPEKETINFDSDIKLTKQEYFKFRHITTKYLFVRDQYHSSNEDVNILLNKIEQLTCEFRTLSHRYDVLVKRYNDEIKEKTLVKTEPIHEEPLAPKNSESEEALRVEIQAQENLSASRLSELQELHKKYLELVEENSMLKKLPDDPNSPHLTSNIYLQHNYDMLYNDCQILKQQVNVYKELINFFFGEKTTQFQVVKSNLAQFRSSVKECITRLNKDLYQIRVEYYKDEYHYKKLIKSRNHIDSEALKLVEVMKNENTQLRNDRISTYREVLVEASDNVQSFSEPILKELENLTNIYEESVAQNSNLVKQIQETENAHLTSLTENLKLTQSTKLLSEEKEALSKKIDESTSFVTEWSVKISQFDKIALDMQAKIEHILADHQSQISISESHKRKANEIYHKYVECNNLYNENKAKLDSCVHQVAELKSRIESECFNNRRNQEELRSLKGKLEFAKKNQYGGATDRILLEEVRLFKSKLTCSSCNVNSKDAVLTKCFHLFCFECLLAAYNSRQRKCPRCSQSFGNHDFHKIYF